MTNNNNKNKKLMLCIPAIIYLVFGVISIIMSIVKKQSVLSIFISVIFIALWTFLLNILCSYGYEVISWILLFLPIIMFMIFIFIGFNLLKSIGIDNDTPQPNIQNNYYSKQQDIIFLENPQQRERDRQYNRQHNRQHNRQQRELYEREKQRERQQRERQRKREKKHHS